MFIGSREENTSVSEYLVLDHTVVHVKQSTTPGKQHLRMIQILGQMKGIEKKMWN